MRTPSLSPNALAKAKPSVAHREMSAPRRAVPYTLVHVVAGETTKDLIIPQVVGHMVEQAQTIGTDRPARVMVLFLEPARVALRPAVRRRVREFRRSAPALAVRLVPYVSRLGLTRSAALVRWLVPSLRRESVVFHCRGETAVQWGAVIAAPMSNVGIVADIRGAWPEELVFARGYDGLDAADARTHADYDKAMSVLREAFDRAGAVLSVSPGMMEWLGSIGVDESRRFYIPCCVARLTYSAEERAAARAALGISDRCVFVYLGTITRYQHVEDGVVPFFRALSNVAPSAHLLCLTTDVPAMRAALERGGVHAARATVVCVPQHDVARYLSAADAGLLLRAPTRLNRLSQPTKLGEYLAAGVPVVVSRGTGVVGEIVTQANAGAIVDVFGRDASKVAEEARRVLDLIARSGPELRVSALRLCDEQFLWSRYIARARAAYRLALGA